ncbi:MAG: hypothetical protein N838_07145 [Thiohalocapsa sp. PB-PSB1]|nr:MAG: hypothetical protein N838_07145 [Thiohalocapsa sp. PB-PSB1]
MICGTLLLCTPLSAQDSKTEGEYEHPEHGNLAEIGAKLSNPVSDVWALFTEFDLNFSDGDINQGDAKVGGRMLFQPILPLPLFGEGDQQWKLITRPTVPILFSQPVPKGFDDFSSIGGIGDIQLPMLVAPPAGNWTLGLGATWLMPTATREAFGRSQWGAGPALVLGYKTEKWLAGVFPQYTFGLGNSDKGPDASYGSMLYWFIYNLPNAWQIGMNPTVTYDNNAASGNQWNVPVGLFVSKTAKVGKVPVKFQLGVEYSVVSQDTFGQEAQIKLNIIPVIPSLIKNPIFGG